MVLYIWKTQYVPVEERHYTPELGSYRSFGIMAVRLSPQGRKPLAYVRDISADQALVAALARRCTRGGLSPAHLRDFILDTLGN